MRIRDILASLVRDEQKLSAPAQPPKDDVPYEVASTEVFRRLYHMGSPLLGDEGLDRNMREIERLQAQLSTVQSASTVAAYRYWLPYFRDKIVRRKKENAQQREFISNRHRVPKV